MKLPEAFLKRMQSKLGAEFPAFLSTYEAPAVKGLRVNPLKVERERFLQISPFPLEEAPFDGNGFYCTAERAGADPYHFAGLYYMQEPSAMCAAPLLEVQAGERVLDLCAAPGGKTGQLAAALKGWGILVSNEYEGERCRALVSNVERLGIQNCVAVNADTGRLAAGMGGVFDKILVDAPCSGEGMFKKEEGAIPNWSEANVAYCAARQSGILDNAALMLKAGGKMVYSTCTFSDEENENQIEEFLKRHREFALISMRTVYPHRARGEGHFAALLQKQEGEEGQPLKPFPVLRDSKAERAYREFSKDFYANGRGAEGTVTTLADGRMLLLPAGAFALPNVRVARAGVELGVWDGKLYKPAHALVMSLKRSEAARFVSLSREESEKYLRGETVQANVENGWCVVGVEDFPLGLGKAVNGTVKNHLPKGLRKVK